MRWLFKMLPISKNQQDKVVKRDKYGAADSSRRMYPWKRVASVVGQAVVTTSSISKGLGRNEYLACKSDRGTFSI